MKLFSKIILKALLFVMPFLFTACKNQLQQNEIIITLEKTPCYGFCPIYLANIYSNGNIHFLPSKNTKVKVPSKSKITKDQLDEITKKADAINFWELNDIYDNKNVTDLPSSILSIKSKDKIKKIKIRHGAPKPLIELLKLVENAVITAQYEPISSH